MSLDAGKREATIVPLRRADALTLALPRHSRFTSYQLVQHLAEHPDLAYRVLGAAEYIVAGFWRRRPEICNVMEMTGKTACGALLDALLDASRSRHCALVVLDPREQERNLPLYRDRGFEVIETLVQLERRGLRVTAQARDAAIRAAEERDIDALLGLERHSFPWLWRNSEAELRWYASVPGVEIYVATAADDPERVVGYAGFTLFQREAHLDRLAVHQAYQAQGYGAALLAFAMRQMNELGANRVALTTQVSNLRSQALYGRFGFRPSGWQHDVLGLWLRQHVERAND